MLDSLVVQAVSTGDPLDFIYRDEDGIPSVRSATVQHLSRCDNGHTILRAFDLNREQPRSFRLDRIEKVAY